MSTKMEKAKAAVTACDEIIKRTTNNPVLGYTFGDRFSRGSLELCAYINARRVEEGKAPRTEDELISFLRSELDVRPGGLILDAWQMCKDQLDGSSNLSDAERIDRLRTILTEAIDVLNQMASFGNAEAQNIKREIRALIG